MVPFVVSLTVLCLVDYVTCEKFSALKDLENILVAEHGIAHDLMEYVKDEELRLDKLKKLAMDFEEHSTEALENPTRHLSNPVNAFLLIKRFTTDWEDIVSSLIRSNTAEVFMDHVNDKAEYFPDSGDLYGAAQALLRLQDTYQLDTSLIATGDLQGVKKSPPLTAGECFEIARNAYNQGDHYHSVLWNTESLDRLKKSGSTDTQLHAEILDYLSFSTYMQGNPQHALNYTIAWLQLEPDQVRAQSNLKYFQQMIDEREKERRILGQEIHEEVLQNIKMRDDARNYEQYKVYEALCRDEEPLKIPRKHQLYCTYLTHDPIFYLVPLHMEVMYFEPFVAVFHDLITDSEIAKVKELAAPRLGQSGVFTLSSGAQQRHVQNYRVSKTAWLGDIEDKLIRRLSIKSATLANLTLDTVEQLQVVNYGIGGHYEPHYDFARPEEVSTFTEDVGNRIATVIYYMTDVESGGFTVFPDIGIKLKPRKGSCALWYNLKKNLEGDYKTRHASCPVLTGTKWICNKWFHERGQELIRPCEELDAHTGY